ncbi:transposase [Nocardia sp. XZ_19_231]|uniref:transposase n=1 Tax=unclassified Nocardia TaxID=2637762 RepID=UPI00188FC618|nr:transposase [Nocardia sp. XZ_19_231]
MSGYTARQRSWAITTYRETREQHRSRMECCAEIAKDLGAHVNTVVRWVNAEFGTTRALSTEEVPSKIRALQAEVTRLRAANQQLSEARVS